ncbi:PAS domain S-box-containing protein [Anaerosolibacter carboniphilus]|uniref:PAS domain S-box-containing protein n=1 Tax=Anaerosolibacter carboniphilus TaxID=1417629 RepID=A0A841KTE9_9FIRM|nr:[Fe-Fe] hydrogenase large subunit C-terminal domain-containing protein [Anaerosolibacter carboniphilus]MBB6216866.1 PAS domain S-box-containing protein [Anaerosolibacter carboniphilus]
MSLLNFSKANCKNCYKCLRSCPVKAIKIKNEQAEIVEERCIGCGQCLIICPQDARNIKSDLEEVKKAIREKRKVIASIAPSFPGAFDMKDPRQIVTALKRIGFYGVEETAIGAEIVADRYDEIVENEKYENLITTCCPSTNYLIDRYFPDLTQYLIPIVSPMLAHGKLLKSIHGRDSYVVFIGPCTAKKIEALSFQHKGTIDGVLTFEELSKWLVEERVNLEELEPSSFLKRTYRRGRAFPLGGGVISSFGKGENGRKYERMRVDGIEECMGIFQSIKEGNIHGVCVEANICRGGCISGPGMPKSQNDFFKRQKKIKAYVNNQWEDPENSEECILPEMNLSKLFVGRPIEKDIASEEELRKILRKIGKFKPSDELNCGGCGYNTCREKAQAVFEGMAELNMCLPNMRSKAESLTNVIFENSPNVIMVVDDKLQIKEFNPTAEKIFGVRTEEIKEKPIGIIMDDQHFQKVKEDKTPLFGQKIYYDEYDVVLLQSIVYVENQNVMLAIMTNISKEEKQRKELKRVKENALNAAQKVIEKQMRVAQEIASLLGETTAETKVTLTKLKEIAIDETGDGE